MTRLGDSEKRLEDFERYLKIERDAIDEALLAQPENFYKVSRECSDAMSWRDRAKKDIKRVRAEADRRLRASLKDGGQKVTDEVIKREVELDQQVQDAEDHAIDWDEVASKWNDLKESMKQRSYALGNLADMYVRGYQMSPSGGSARSEVLNRSAAEARAGMADARRRERLNEKE